MCADLHGSSVTPQNTHNWMHCSGRVFLSGEDRLNCSAVAKNSPAAGCGPPPEKCTLSAVTMKALHIVHQVDGGGSVCVLCLCLTVVQVFVYTCMHMCCEVFVYQQCGKHQRCWVINKVRCRHLHHCVCSLGLAAKHKGYVTTESTQQPKYLV